jgi:hypothetical protein
MDQTDSVDNSRDGEPLTQEELIKVSGLAALENPLKNRVQIKKTLDLANKEATSEIKNLIEPK